jgi:excinuclease ABC subunit A
VIDLGPEGGEAGGFMIAEGSPESLILHRESKTGRALRDAGSTQQPTPVHRK